MPYRVIGSYTNHSRALTEWHTTLASALSAVVALLQGPWDHVALVPIPVTPPIPQGAPFAQLPLFPDRRTPLPEVGGLQGNSESVSSRLSAPRHSVR